MTRTAVYRHYDAEGRLLYVGMSANPTRRLYEHKCRAEWAAQVKRSEIEWFDTRAEALAVEASNIASMAPQQNIVVPVDAPADSAAGFARAFGVDDLARALGVTRSSVRAAITRRIFPARWAYIVADICRDTGLRCRMDAFSWKGSSGRGALCISEVMFHSEGAA